jgi:hypothetical protein
VQLRIQVRILLGVHDEQLYPKFPPLTNGMNSYDEQEAGRILSDLQQIHSILKQHPDSPWVKCLSNWKDIIDGNLIVAAEDLKHKESK